MAAEPPLKYSDFAGSRVDVQDERIALAAIEKAAGVTFSDVQREAAAQVLDEWRELLKEFYASVFRDGF